MENQFLFPESPGHLDFCTRSPYSIIPPTRHITVRERIGEFGQGHRASIGRIG